MDKEILTTVPLYLKKALGVYRTEEVAQCPLCAETQFVPYTQCRKGWLRFDLIKCGQCGLVVQSPRLNSGSLSAFYERDYRENSAGNKPGRVDAIFERGQRRGQYITQFLTQNGIAFKDKAVFEYGCGYGGILEHFRKQGCRVAGCDIDQKVIAWGREKGLDMQVADINSANNIFPQADILILSHVLEHISDPVSFMGKILKLLVPGGYVYLEVPGLNNPRGELKRNVQVGHLIYFTLETCTSLGTKVNLKFINGNEVVQSCFQS